MNRLVFAGTELRDLRSSLLAGAPLESAGALVARRGQGTEGSRFVVIETLVAADEDYLDRSEGTAVLSPSFVARALRCARDERASLFLIHTHPFQDWPEFSKIDVRGEATIAPSLYGRAEGPHGSLVFGSEGFAARLIDERGKTAGEIECLIEASGDVRVQRRDVRDTFDEMYDRNVRALGHEGQKRLRSLHIGIVGVGGTGSFAVEELTRLGVGQLTLIDDEDLEATNLNRVIGASHDDVGKAKVDVLAEVARRARPDIVLRPIRGSVLREKVARRLIDCDVVFCCTDSHGSRAVINQIAYQYLVPTFDIGVRIDSDGLTVTGATTRVQMLGPGLPCLACYPLLSPEAIRRDLLTPEARESDPYIVGFQEPQPAVVSINGTTTSSAVTMFLTAVTGLPGHVRHLVGRPLDGTVRAALGKPTPDCVVCAPNNAFRQADNWPMMWAG